MNADASLGLWQRYTAATGGGGAGKGDPADEFAPDPYDEDEHAVAQDNETDNFSPAVKELMKKCASARAQPTWQRDRALSWSLRSQVLGRGERCQAGG